MDRLRPTTWAQDQLGHESERSTYRWLKRHQVRVVSGRLLESEFYRVWRRPAFDPAAIIEEALRS